MERLSKRIQLTFESHFCEYDVRDFSITFRFCSFLANFSRIWFCISSRLVLPIIQLEKFLKNPLDLGYQFYMDEHGVNGYAEQSYSFLQTVSQFEPGKLLYIGGVIDYHF